MSEIDSDTPLSDLIRTGWEIVNVSSSFGGSGLTEQSLILRRGAEHKLVTIRKKYMGSGVVAEAYDL